jgi:YfiH family protein
MVSLRRADNLNGPGIAHGFFERGGGVSTGIYASLNSGPGSSDTRENVVENRRRVADALGSNVTLLSLHQIHSPKSVRVTQPWQIGEGPQADAMATNVPCIALGILTADCAPVLFADAEAKVIGAAHAGWKGVKAGVIDAAIAEMEALGAKRRRIAAAIGPCISQANYEVGPEFHAAFVGESPDDARFFAEGQRANHYQFDLESYVARRLDDAAIANVVRLGACTYADEAAFFSFRRTTHRGEKDYGRQISTIVLK